MLCTFCFVYGFSAVLSGIFCVAFVEFWEVNGLLISSGMRMGFCGVGVLG